MPPLTRILFGSDWSIPWHIFMWLGFLTAALLFKALADDALRTPRPTPSLGTFGVLMLVVIPFALFTPINLARLTGSLNTPWWLVTLICIASLILIPIGLTWLLSTMAEHGGRARVALTLLLLLILTAANFLASGATPTSATPSPRSTQAPHADTAPASAL